VAVDLHGGDRRPGLGQGEGERAEAGADLDHVVAGADTGQPGDLADGGGLDDEVLSEGAGRREPVGGEEAGHLAARQGHAHSVYQVPGLTR
jgi:hypothetical protein